MAVKKISSEKLFKKDWISKPTEEFIQFSDTVTKELKEIAKVAEEAFKNIRLKDSKDVNKLIDGLKKSKQAVSNLDKFEKMRLATLEKLKTANATRTKQNTELKVQLQEQTKANKQLAREELGLVKAHEKLTLETKKAEKEFRDLAVQHGVNSKQAQKALLTFRKLDRQLKQVNTTTRKSTRAFSGFKGLLVAGAGFLGLTSAVSFLRRGISNVIDIFTSFEKANSKLEAVLGATEDQMRDLQIEAKLLGATTSFTASQVTGLQTEFAKLGFPTKDIIEMTSSTLAAAEAMGSDLGAQAALTGSTLKAFGLAASDASRVNDVLSKATSSSALDFDKLNASMSTIAPVAAKFGFSLEGTTALLGSLSDAGFDASSAATATRNILLNLADTNGKLAKSLKEPVTDLPSLVKGLEQLKSEGIDLGEALELTDKRSVAAFSTFLSGTESVLSLNSALENAVGTAERMAEVQLDNLTGDITILNSAWEGFVLSVEDGEGALNSTLRTVIKTTTRIISGLTRQTTAIDKNIKSLENERDTLFDLSSQILDVNINASKRNELLDELESLYPELLENIDRETVSYQELREVLSKANDELNVRVQIQQALIDVEGAQGSVLRSRARILELETEIRKEAVKVLREQGRETELFGLTIEETIDLVKDEVSIFSNFNDLLRFRTDNIKILASEEKRLNEERQISNATITALLSGETKLESLSTEELRTLVLNGQLLDEKLERQAKLIIILREREERQKGVNEADKEEGEINKKKKKVETDLIRLKQKEITERRKVAAATEEETAIKNQEIKALQEELRILKELGDVKDEEEEEILTEFEIIEAIRKLRNEREIASAERRTRDEEDKDLALTNIEDEFFLKEQEIRRIAQREIDINADTAAEILLIQEQLKNDLADLEDQKLQKVKNVNSQVVDDTKDTVKDLLNEATDLLEEELAKRAELRSEAQGEEITRQEELIDRLRQNASEATEKALAFEEARLEKARLKKQRDDEKAARKAEAIALAQTFLNQVAEQSKENPDTAIAEAFKNTFLARAIAQGLAGLYEGTDEVGSTGSETKFSDGRDGYVARLDKGEKVFTKSESAELNKMGYKKRTDVMDLVRDHHEGNTWAFMPRFQAVEQQSVEADYTPIIESNNKVIKAIEDNAVHSEFDLSGLNTWFETRFKGHTKEIYKIMLEHFKK